MIVLAVLAAMFQQEPAKQEKPADPKEALKKIIVDFDKTYRQCFARFQAAKTTADRQDASNGNFTEINEWVRANNETRIEFECQFVDVFRSDQHGYEANFTIPKQLMLFMPGKKPLRCKQKITLPVTPELRDSLIKGIKVSINAELVAQPFATRSEPNGIYDISAGNMPQALFQIVLNQDDPYPKFSETDSHPQYSTTFILQDITIVPDQNDLKKAVNKKIK